MNIHHPWIGVAALAVVLTMPVTEAVQPDANGRAPAAKEWPTVGADWGNSRYSMLGQITTQNVTRLGGAWMSQKFDQAASSRAMPVVKDGMIFVTAPPAVYALNAKTGTTVWRFQAGGGRGQAAAQNGLGSPAREGVAVGEGLVFVGLSAARIIALNEKTGELVWNQYVGDNPRDKGQVASGAPLYAGGLVSIGLSPANGWRGQGVRWEAT